MYKKKVPIKYIEDKQGGVYDRIYYNDDNSISNIGSFDKVFIKGV